MSININEAWELLHKQIETCTKCPLYQTRHKIVIGEGPRENCMCVLIGEAPGEDEDNIGRPFVGKAGQLLTKILENGGGISRNSLYIMNTLKCRPDKNRDPEQKELLACNDYLEAQLLLLQPSIIVTLGNIATRWLLKTEKGIMSMRGRWQEWRGIKLLPMYHPSFLLRQKGEQERKYKNETWDDVKKLKQELDKLTHKE